MESQFNFVQEVLSFFPQDKTIWLAYSGGLDSQVLLHLLVCAKIKFKAVHIHHGLSPHADAWADHCAAACEKHQIEFHLHRIDAAASLGQSPEAIAREKRYQTLANLLQTEDVLLTAHHQNDQAETMLLQMLRGAGPKGLASMPQKKILAKGFHIRPLLNVSRDELKNYAEQHQLNWIEDESNANAKFSRNFIRHEILPVLQKRWQGVPEALARSAQLCAETHELLALYLQQDLKNCAGSQLNTLSVKKLLQLDKVKQRLVVREWLSAMNFSMPSAKKMQQLINDMLHAAEDRMPLITWGEVELRRYRDDLFAMQKLSEHDATQSYQWDLTKPLVLSVGILSAKESQGMVTVRFRQGGEVCYFNNKHQDLKKLFQQWGVPPWLRNRIPLIYAEDKLIAVPGFFVDTRYSATYCHFRPHML